MRNTNEMTKQATDRLIARQMGRDAVMSKQAGFGDWVNTMRAYGNAGMSAARLAAPKTTNRVVQLASGSLPGRALGAARSASSAISNAAPNAPGGKSWSQVLDGAPGPGGRAASGLLDAKNTFDSAFGKSSAAMSKQAEMPEIIQRLVNKVKEIELPDSIKNIGDNIQENGLLGYAQQLKDRIADPKTVNDEAIRNALIGSGVGGGAGLLRSLGSPRRSLIGDTLRGAAAGGALGGGGTLLYRNLVNPSEASRNLADVAQQGEEILSDTERGEAGVAPIVRAVDGLDAVSDSTVGSLGIKGLGLGLMGADGAAVLNHIQNVSRKGFAGTLSPNELADSIQAAVARGEIQVDNKKLEPMLRRIRAMAHQPEKYNEFLETTKKLRTNTLAFNNPELDVRPNATQRLADASGRKSWQKIMQQGTSGADLISAEQIERAARHGRSYIDPSYRGMSQLLVRDASKVDPAIMRNQPTSRFNLSGAQRWGDMRAGTLAPKPGMIKRLARRPSVAGAALIGADTVGIPMLKRFTDYMYPVQSPGDIAQGQQNFIENANQFTQ